VFLPLGICDEVGRKIAIYAVNKRLEDLHISYKGVEVTARIAMVVSTSDKPFDSFLDFFIKADKKLTQLHKSEK
jgi:hypothetical protein